MLLEIHPYNPQSRYINQVIDVLQNDGVIIYPTDTVYGLGCNIYSKKALKKIKWSYFFFVLSIFFSTFLKINEKRDLKTNTKH